MQSESKFASTGVYQGVRDCRDAVRNVFSNDDFKDAEAASLSANQSQKLDYRKQRSLKMDTVEGFEDTGVARESYCI